MKDRIPMISRGVRSEHEDLSTSKWHEISCPLFLNRVAEEGDAKR